MHQHSHDEMSFIAYISLESGNLAILYRSDIGYLPKCWNFSKHYRLRWSPLKSNLEEIHSEDVFKNELIEQVGRIKKKRNAREVYDQSDPMVGPQYNGLGIVDRQEDLDRVQNFRACYFFFLFSLSTEASGTAHLIRLSPCHRSCRPSPRTQDSAVPGSSPCPSPSPTESASERMM